VVGGSRVLTNLLFLLFIHLMAWGWVRRRRSLDAFLMLRGVSVAAVAVLSLPLATGGMRAVLICVLAVVWGARLTSHHVQRERLLGPERWLAEWKAEAGEGWFVRALTHLALPQAVLLWACSLAIQRGILTGANFSVSVLDYLGLMLVAGGMGFETLADHQLLVFRRSRAGKAGVLGDGLWALSRHPNHFGTLVVGAGFYLLAASGGDGLWSLVAPILTFVVLTRVSGGARSEVGRDLRRPGYARYRHTTSALLPLPPRNRSEAPMPAETLRYLGDEDDPAPPELPDS